MDDETVTDSVKVRVARAEVEACKAALLDTVRELQGRLQPRSLASEAWGAAKNKGADLAEEAVDAVRSRPIAVGGAIAALAMFFAREPIKDAARRFYDGMTSSNDKSDEPIAVSKVRPVRRRTRKPTRAALKMEKPL